MSYDPALIQELRMLALDGAKPVDLIRCIQKRECYAPNFVVPVLAYLRHAFGVPLRVILPLREEMGIGRDSNVLSVVFWFAATMLEHAELEPPNRDVYERMNRFDKEALAAWRTDESSRLECARFPEGVYARGMLAILVDPDGISAADIQRRIRDFASQHQRMVAESINGTRGSRELPRMMMDFEIKPAGPTYRVECKVRTLIELIPHLNQPILSSV
jgi:hypothetical protein